MASSKSRSKASGPTKGVPSASRLLLEFGLDTSSNLFRHLQPQILLLMYVCEELARMNRRNPAITPSERRECIEMETTLKGIRKEMMDGKKALEWLDDAVEAMERRVDEEMEKLASSRPKDG